MRLPERRVDIRQVSITLKHGSPKHSEGFLGECPGFAAFGINMRMCSEEGHPHAELIPANGELLGGIFEEARNVRAGE